MPLDESLFAFLKMPNKLAFFVVRPAHRGTADFAIQEKLPEHRDLGARLEIGARAEMPQKRLARFATRLFHPRKNAHRGREAELEREKTIKQRVLDGSASKETLSKRGRDRKSVV